MSGDPQLLAVASAAAAVVREQGAASPTSIHPASATRDEHYVADAQYQRFLMALDAYLNHRVACSTCTIFRRCSEGWRLWGDFTRSQDSYLQRQRNQRGKHKPR